MAKTDRSFQMTLEDLICMKRISSKMIVTEMNVETLEQKRIFEGYETDICDQTEEAFDEFYTANKFRTVINFGAVLDRNGLPAVNILVYA
jgi:hypothetical protein